MSKDVKIVLVLINFVLSTIFVLYLPTVVETRIKISAVSLHLIFSVFHPYNIVVGYCEVHTWVLHLIEYDLSGLGFVIELKLNSK